MFHKIQYTIDNLGINILHIICSKKRLTVRVRRQNLMLDNNKLKKRNIKHHMNKKMISKRKNKSRMIYNFTNLKNPSPILLQKVHTSSLMLYFRTCQNLLSFLIT